MNGRSNARSALTFITFITYITFITTKKQAMDRHWMGLRAGVCERVGEEFQELTCPK